MKILTRKQVQYGRRLLAQLTDICSGKQTFSYTVSQRYKIISTMGYPKKVSGRELLEIFWSMSPDPEGGDRVERVLSEVGGDWGLTEVPLSEIPFSDSNVKGIKSQKLITKYSKPGEMPPVILDVFDGEYEIVDGFHRIAAAKKRGDVRIKAYIPIG